jgi:CRISPR/Cas system Type II protein with McrA/HNH and RuvC-like nuclease domain
MSEKNSPKRTLALDLSPSSIGWALVDEANEQIIATGVRVFPEGVADYGTISRADQF